MRCVPSVASPISMKRNVYDRHILHEEVWAHPMTEVAARYGISDVMLRKICRKLDVPTPPRGYWAKVEADQKPRAPKLPRKAGEERVFGRGLEENEMKDSSGTGGIDLLGEEEADFIRTVADGIKHHPKAKLRPCLEELKARGGCQGAGKRVNQPQRYSFEEEVSARQIGRTATILETLARALEEVGGALENTLTVELFGETAHLEIFEKTKKEPHSITPEEKREQQKYEHYGWGSRTSALGIIDSMGY